MKKILELLNNIINLADTTKNINNSKEITSNMEILYEEMRIYNSGRGVHPKDIFEKLASTIKLNKDSILYKICIDFCEDIENNPVNEALTHHNKKHFIEVMINCFILAKIENIENKDIHKLLFTGLVHDYKYKTKKELLEECKDTSFIIEEYSYNMIEEFLKTKSYSLEEEEISEILKFAKALIATTDIFSKEAKELVEILNIKNMNIKNIKINTFINQSKNKNCFLNESAKYFQENPKNILCMNILLLSDVFSSCVLKNYSKWRNRNLLNGELKLNLREIDLSKKYNEFSNKISPTFERGRSGSFFFSKFQETKSLITKNPKEIKDKKLRKYRFWKKLLRLINIFSCQNTKLEKESSVTTKKNSGKIEERKSNYFLKVTPAPISCRQNFIDARYSNLT